MNYTFKDVFTWAFTHPEIKPSTNNFVHLCFDQLGEVEKWGNADFTEAVSTLQQIAEISNPAVCSGLFAKAQSLFVKARQTQRDEPKLMSYIGEMFCNHWMGQDYLNPQLQQEISTMKYEGSFWHRYGDTVISLGSAAIAGIGMLCGAPAGAAAGSSSKGANGLLETHSEDTNAKVKHFNNLRNTVLSLRFC